MKKLTLVMAVSVISAGQVFADDVFNYSLDMQSGTTQDSPAGFVNTASGVVNSWYVDPVSGAASNKTTPAIQLTRSSDWTFDFTNPAAVSFSGALYLGDYRVQTSLPIPLVDGRQTFTGVVQSFAGTGVYDDATNTFTYQFFNAVSGGGSASVYAATSAATCANGQTNVVGKVCGAYAAATPNWEGLALTFVFAEDKSSFTGSLQGRDVSSSGITRLSTLINWHVWEEPASLDQSAVPVPASAWLFGSGLMGLVAAKRRRRMLR